MILAYFCTLPFGRMKYSIPLVFAASVLPDLDFLFLPWFPHESITHSLTFWSLFYIPFIIVYRQKALPYLVATFSHFLIGDMITGSPMLLYGLSDQTFGTIRPWVVQNYGINYGLFYQAAVDVAMIIGFVIFGTARSVRPVLTTDATRDVLLLLVLVFVIFFGAYTNDIVYMLKQQAPPSTGYVLYLGYGIVSISHAAFAIMLWRGSIQNVIKVRQKAQMQYISCLSTKRK
jgi:hypothetical protein